MNKTKNWREYFGYPNNYTPAEEELRVNFHSLAKQYHPDLDYDSFNELKNKPDESLRVYWKNLGFPNNYIPTEEEIRNKKTEYIEYKENKMKEINQVYQLALKEIREKRAYQSESESKYEHRPKPNTSSDFSNTSETNQNQSEQKVRHIISSTLDLIVPGMDNNNSKRMEDTFCNQIRKRSPQLFLENSNLEEVKNTIIQLCLLLRFPYLAKEELDKYSNTIEKFNYMHENMKREVRRISETSYDQRQKLRVDEGLKKNHSETEDSDLEVLRTLVLLDHAIRKYEYDKNYKQSETYNTQGYK